MNFYVWVNYAEFHKTISIVVYKFMWTDYLALGKNPLS